MGLICLLKSTCIKRAVFYSSDSGAQPYMKAVNKRSHESNYTSVGVLLLSIFGGNFVLAKGSLGAISVHYTELRGIRFFMVNQSGASNLFAVDWSLLFRGFVIRTRN